MLNLFTGKLQSVQIIPRANLAPTSSRGGGLVCLRATVVWKGDIDSIANA